MYYIHDNGGCPFRVDIDDARVSVDALTEHDVYEPFVEFIACEVFIGTSPKNDMTEFSCGYGPEFDGNSIVLRIGNGKYVYIGTEIYSFTAENPIISFVSPVGNSDVPYPYAIDEKQNYYLMEEKVIITKKHPAFNEADPIWSYYDLALITPDRSRIPPKQPVCDIGIDFRYTGECQSTFTAMGDPSSEYNRLTKSDTREMSIVTTEGDRVVLTRDAYVQLVNDFRKKIGVRSLDTTTIRERIW